MRYFTFILLTFGVAIFIMIYSMAQQEWAIGFTYMTLIVVSFFFEVRDCLRDDPKYKALKNKENAQSTDEN